MISYVALSVAEPRKRLRSGKLTGARYDSAICPEYPNCLVIHLLRLLPTRVRQMLRDQFTEPGPFVGTPRRLAL